MSAEITIPRTDRWFASYRRRGWRGFHALWRMRQKFGGDATLRVRTKFGSVFALQPYDAIDACVLRHGYYESEIIEALRPFFGPGAVFWDVGANFGLHAITAKRLVPEMTVVAFEPSPRLAARVRQHAELNRVTVQLEPLALTATTRTQTLHVAGSGNSGMTTLHAMTGVNYLEHVEVAGHAARELVERGSVPAPTVMKIDVEGSEAEVLAGLGPLLAEPRLRALVIEAEPGLERTTAAHPLATPLREAGFALTPLTRREPTHHALENYLATRRP